MGGHSQKSISLKPLLQNRLGGLVLEPSKTDWGESGAATYPKHNIRKRTCISYNPHYQDVGKTHTHTQIQIHCQLTTFVVVSEASSKHTGHAYIFSRFPIESQLLNAKPNRNGLLLLPFPRGVPVGTRA